MVCTKPNFCGAIYESDNKDEWLKFSPMKEIKDAQLEKCKATSSSVIKCVIGKDEISCGLSEPVENMERIPVPRS